MFFIIGGDGKEYGPVSADQINTWIVGGRANLDTRAKRDGSEEWKRLAQFAEFGGASPAADTSFNEAPPSLVSSSTQTFAPAQPTEGYEPAGRGSRLGAAVIDYIIMSLACSPGLFLLGGTFLTAVAAASKGEHVDMEGLVTSSVIFGFLLLGFMFLAVTVTQIVMLSLRGQTIGKRLVGIKIVQFRDDSPAGFMHAWLLRSFVPGLISFFLNLIFWLGSIFTLVDICLIFRDDRRCIHDLIAGTRVVKVKKP